MKKIIIWIFALALLISTALALEGGSSNSYSTDPAKYLLLTNFNGSNAATPNAQTGQNMAWTTASITNNDALFPNGPSVSAICFNLGVGDTGQAPTKSFTIEGYFTDSDAIQFSPEIDAYSDPACSGVQSTQPFRFGVGHGNTGFLGEFSYIDGQSGAAKLNIPGVAGVNYAVKIYMDVANLKVNYTVYTVSNSSGTLVYTELGTTAMHNWIAGVNTVRSLRIRHNYDVGSAGATIFNELAIYNGTTRPTGSASAAPDTTPPSITYFNLINDNGCENWNTDKTNPCSTSSMNPTVQFNTTENAWCAIAASTSPTALNLNYSDMGNSRNCTGDLAGEGATSHRCTLALQDELVYDNSYIYISCKDDKNNQNKTSTSGPLKLSVTGLESSGRNLISLGIQHALLSGYTSYSDLQIYTRTQSNSQAKGTFDIAAKKGNKMWAFNRIGISDAYANVFNLTPVLYTLEFANTTSGQITNLVEMMINATK